MTDDNLDDVQQQVEKKLKEEQFNPLMTAKQILDRRGSVGMFDSSDANLGATKKGYAVPPDSVYEKEIWNAAIEAAAKRCEEILSNHQAKEIRKLKK